jgi:hypothetical protein
MNSREICFSTTEVSSKNYLLLFVIWPFLALITAFMNYSDKTAKKVVYFFLIYYGLTFFISADSFNDAARYSLSLKANASLPFKDIFKVIGGLNSDTSIDIIDPLISFIVSRITSHYSLLFAVYAAIFGFFYLKSINLLYNRYKDNPGWNALVHLIFFAAILPITAINGFRMWTAVWIFFYGAYHVTLFRDTRFLLITLFAPLVHWSFVIPNAILLIYFFVGNRNIFYLPLVLASFILPQFMTQYFSLISLKLGGSLQNRYEMYSDSSYVAGVQESAADLSWFMKIGSDLVFYYLLLAIIVARLKSRSFDRDKAAENLFSFLLLFLSFVNFGMGIPSLGVRFRMVFFIFATLYIFMYLVRFPGKKINVLTLIGLFPMLLHTAIAFRQGSDSINAWILSPFLGLPLFTPGVSVASLLF